MKNCITLFISAYLLLSLANAQCISSGPTDAALSSNNTDIGTVAWTNMSATQVSDDNRASVSILVDTNTTITSNYLYIQGFGFSIPAGSTICGIEINIELRQVGAVFGSSSVRDNSILLLDNNGLIAGSNHASGTEWSSSDENRTYGNSTDMWGLTLTEADINDPDFGVAISVNLQASITAMVLSGEIDHVSMAVHYSLPLPVELLSFEANHVDREVTLTWATASETNNAFFSIERSTDAVHWERVGQVSGAGNSNVQQDYSFVDQQPSTGMIYYQLKQTDTDGAETLMKTISTHVDAVADIIAYYDPSFEAVVIHGIPTGEKFMVDIYDISGNKITGLEGEASEKTMIPVKSDLKQICFVSIETVHGKVVHKLYF